MKEICSICYGSVNVESVVQFDGEVICTDCFEDEVVICEYCGAQLLRDDAEYCRQRYMCQNCFEEHFVTCVDCGRVMLNEEANYINDNYDYAYCDDCYDRREQDFAIQNYCYKPMPIFYGDGPRFLGVELEIDDGGEDSENATLIKNIANKDEEYIYCKKDGSLEYGFEIVTHPMTLDYHCNKLNWSRILEKASSLGYHSHQTSTCGLHIHVSRLALGQTEKEQDVVIARVLYFFEKYWDNLLKFSRRTESQLQRWANRYGFKEQPSEILDCAKKGYGGGRYTCVNLCNYSTIEFRIFRGTLKFSTLIATLQMVNHICDVAIKLSDEVLMSLTWNNFVAQIPADTYPELISYLKERRIYEIQDSIEGEV
ncbi:amidoligase family protein [Anaerotignum sp.]|uniref:amidoligase family protein n=1 Tax=Anaerotignum sp. TaxID=2039241 RepID=UPI0028AF87C0|nr:amidoligase family protein [Anaerotignum sp.]